MSLQPEELIRSYIDAYNRFDVDAMCALLASDVRFEHHAGGVLGAQADGAKEFRQLAEMGAALFAAREQRIIAMRVDGNHAVVEIAFAGTLAGDIPRGPVAGTVLALEGTSEFVVTDGLIGKVIDRS